MTLLAARLLKVSTRAKMALLFFFFLLVLNEQRIQCCDTCLQLCFVQLIQRLIASLFAGVALERLVWIITPRQ